MLSRRTAGNMKHVETNILGLQDVAHRKAVTSHQLPTDNNVTDILTKYLAASSPVEPDAHHKSAPGGPKQAVTQTISRRVSPHV